jgi:hypothetical protein
MQWMSGILVGEMAGAYEDFGIDNGVGELKLLCSLIQFSKNLMDQMILSEPSIIIIWTYQERMEWMSRTLVAEMAGADEDFSVEVGKIWLSFFISLSILEVSMIHMDQMILSEPPIIIIWTYQDRMEWMSRILVGEMAGADEDFGKDVGKIWLVFVHIPTHSQSQHDPHGLDDPFRTINYHHLDISGQDGMDEQDIGWRNGWC